jgi:uncharacterized protein (TIGR02145 family)
LKTPATCREDNSAWICSFNFPALINEYHQHKEFIPAQCLPNTQLYFINHNLSTMKNTMYYKLSMLLFSVLILASFTACDKDNPEPEPQTLTDYDGNEYTFVTIGEQVWMVENLKVTHYNDGEPIALVASNEDWANQESGAYCWYDNDQEKYMESYGAIYNRYAANSGKLCPTGWHVASDADWTQLRDYLGGWQSEPAYKLKEGGYDHWKPENQFFTTNETGFTARGGGLRNPDGTFEGILDHGNWWASGDHFQYEIWGRRMQYNHGHLLSIGSDEELGFSVRCIKSE